LSVSFLAPAGALVALAALLPVAGAWAAERRAARVRNVLGLTAPARRAMLPVAVAWAASFSLFGLAAAEPVVRVAGTAERRTDAQAFVVVDITRSMLAAPDPDAPRRIDRAVEAAVEIRRALGDIPVGVASITNRPLPHLFPTTDAGQFELVIDQAIGVGRPPATAKVLFAVSTDLDAVGAMATDNFFAPESTKRLAILLTDGESAPFASRLLVEKLHEGGVEVVALRLWSEDERVWRSDGTLESGYRPLRSALQWLDELAGLTTGERVYGEDEVGDAVAAARRYLGDGPAVEVPAPGRTVSLAPYAVLAACIPLAALLLPAAIRRRGRLAYSMVAPWRASSSTIGSRLPVTRAPSRQTSSAPRSSMGGSSPAPD
jgi:hypothetical protein